MKITLIFLLAFLTCYMVTAECPVQQCHDAVQAILAEPYVCEETPGRIMKALNRCRRDPACNSTHLNRLATLGNEIQAKSIQANCPATAQQQRDCNLAQTFECATGSANLVIIFSNISRSIALRDLAQFCIDISSIANTINVCQKCIQGLIPGWQNFSEEVDRIFDIAVTFVNGACNCSRLLFNHITTGIKTDTDCNTVRTVTTFVRIIASDCAVKLINLPLQLDWLEIVDNYIVFFTGYIGTVCSIFGGAGPAPSTNTILLLVAAVFSFFLLRFRR